MVTVDQRGRMRRRLGELLAHWITFHMLGVLDVTRTASSGNAGVIHGTMEGPQNLKIHKVTSFLVIVVIIGQKENGRSNLKTTDGWKMGFCFVWAG